MQDHAAKESRLPDATLDVLRAAVEEAERDRATLERHANAVREVVYRLDQGSLRVAEKGAAGWTIHGWIQQAINLFFAVARSEPYNAGDLKFFDKIPPREPLGDYRVVPPGVVRYGAFLEQGAIVMPGYVNIGARVGAAAPWSTPGRRSGPARRSAATCTSPAASGIGGVLEPPGARPVIIEDGAFIGSRVHRGRRRAWSRSEAVLGAGVVLTASTADLRRHRREPEELRGRDPRAQRGDPGHAPARSSRRASTASRAR